MHITHKLNIIDAITTIACSSSQAYFNDVHYKKTCWHNSEKYATLHGISFYRSTREVYDDD